MHAEFWQARWTRSEIGFHLPEVNPYLQQFWPALALPAGTRVLVPLCGKSLDLAWLAGQGYQVTGVELAQRAVEDFFIEHGLEPEVSEVGAFRLYRAGAVEIYCGDFFALTAPLAGCTALYDRAALIALPAEMRGRYVAHLTHILPSGCQGLLVTLDYDQAQMEGPPFAVAHEEVQRLYTPAWQLQNLGCADVLGENWKFLQRGLEHLDERVYQLSKN
jgi:thiopurine S-methyltransferase